MFADVSSEGGDSHAGEVLSRAHCAQALRELEELRQKNLRRASRCTWPPGVSHRCPAGATCLAGSRFRTKVHAARSARACAGGAACVMTLCVGLENPGGLPGSSSAGRVPDAVLRHGSSTQ